MSRASEPVAASCITHGQISMCCRRCSYVLINTREYYTYLIRRRSVYTSGILGASISFVGCLLCGGMNIIDMFLALFLGTLWISPSAEGLSLGLSNMVNC